MSDLTLQSVCVLEVYTGAFGLSQSVPPITVNGIPNNGLVDVQLSGALANGTFPLISYPLVSSFNDVQDNFFPSVPPPFSATLYDNHNGLISVIIGGGPGPNISQQPINQTVCTGDPQPASFSVSVSESGGGTDFEYQWYVSTDGGKTWQPDTDPADVGAVVSMGGDSETLEVGSISSKNGYMYEVVVTDDGNNATTSSFATLNINPSITIYNVTGGGFYCSGGPGASIGLSGSDPGVIYTVYMEPWVPGEQAVGTGSQFYFPIPVTAGTYGVMAKSATGDCPIAMNGTVTVTLNQPPVAGNNLWGTTQNYPVSVPEVNPLQNASSPNPNPVYTFTGLGPTPGSSSISLPSGASVATAKGIITYTPPGNTSVTSDSFTYNFTDGDCTALGTVNVTIVPPMTSVTPQLNNVAIQGIKTCVDLAYSGQPNTTYTLQFSTDFTVWRCIEAVGPPSQTGPLYYFTGCPTGSAPPAAGYYRIVTGGCPP
jgi:hypothetical protein